MSIAIKGRASIDPEMLDSEEVPVGLRLFLRVRRSFEYGEDDYFEKCGVGRHSIDPIKKINAKLILTKFFSDAQRSLASARSMNAHAMIRMNVPKKIVSA